MSAEVLRRAAALKMRIDASECGDSPADFIPAVADLLTAEVTSARARARQASEWVGKPVDVDSVWVPVAALNVARAYLGEQS